MFIHLNVGWMSHPFPLSSFKITSQEQLETIRALALTRMTWSPERSDAEPVEAVATATVELGDATTESPAVPAPAEKAPDPRAAARAALLAQREAAARCERQFGEACKDLRRTFDKATTDPTGAREDARLLAQALLDKMLAEGDPCLRVLGESVSDRAAAHPMNVTVISLMLARQLTVPRALLLDLGVGALMHDIGKSVLPDRVRLPRDDFSAAESALYRDHVAEGLAIGRRMGLAPDAQLVIAQHHEFADGSGFPGGIPLQRMSLGARIVSLVNRYDNLCNASTPSLSLTPHESLSKLFAQCRNKFDQTLLSGFIKMMGIYPPGSIVQLTDDRYAMVMTVNATQPLKPRVLAYDADVPVDQAAHLDLGRHARLGIRRSLRAAQLPHRVAEYLEPRQRLSWFFDIESGPVVETADDPAA
jgi:putative nucleotidyltransferase with HDIG domain